MTPIAPTPAYPTEAMLAFVGEPIAIEEDGYACTAYQVDERGKESCLFMDSVYRGRYRVVDSLVGAPPAGDEVVLRMSGHGGIPDDAYRPKVLLLAARTASGLRLLRYQAHAVERTVDGRWAACGDPLDGGGHSRAQALGFPPGTDFGPPADDPGFIERRLQGAEPGDYELRDGRLLCRRGIHVDEIVRRWGRVR